MRIRVAVTVMVLFTLVVSLVSGVSVGVGIGTVDDASKSVDSGDSTDFEFNSFGLQRQDQDSNESDNSSDNQQGSGLGVSILQDIDSERIILRVTRGSNPVEGARVNVTTIRGNNILDGNYITDKNGRVIFNPEKTEKVSGVLHLRIEVEEGGNENVVFASVTVIRTPDLSESGPIGQRITSVLHKSVANTRGTIAGSFYVNSIESYSRNTTKVTFLREHATRLIETLRKKQSTLKTLELRFQTGEININKYYARTLNESVQVSRIRNDLFVTLERLTEFSDETLRQNNVNPLDLQILYRDLRNNNRLTYERGILMSENNSSNSSLVY